MKLEVVFIKDSKLYMGFLQGQNYGKFWSMKSVARIKPFSIKNRVNFYVPFKRFCETQIPSRIVMSAYGVEQLKKRVYDSLDTKLVWVDDTRSTLK